MVRSLRFTFILFTLFTCTSKQAYSPEQLRRYREEIDTWHVHRVEQIKARDGWLNLLGLYWLDPGINTFGSGKGNHIVFPEGTIPAEAGYFMTTGNRVDMHINDGVRISLSGNPVVDATIFQADSARQPTVGNELVEWSVIRRDSKLGIRLRDLTMQGVKDFQGIERFPVDPAYRVEGTFEPAAGRTIEISNVIGQTTSQASPGTIVFAWDGKTYRLDVLSGNKDEYFVIIADDTSGEETYAAGRYIYVKHEDENGKIVIDFNKAYNPPCVFTPHATCPLPPRQNILPFSVRAGEKNYGHEPHAIDTETLAGKVSP